MSSPLLFYSCFFRTNNGAPASKILLGIPTYGRTWNLENEAKYDQFPVTDLDGPGEPGPLTKEAGLLSYPEICTKIEPQTPKGGSTPGLFKSVVDGSKRKG